MLQEAESFFIAKIQEGLSYSSDSLSAEDLRILRTPAAEVLLLPGFTPEIGQRLNAKCIGALAEVYARDTLGKNRDAVLRWRERNGELYRSSQLVVSGIVQNWYLSVGRGQEKKATGCLPILVVVAALLAAAWWIACAAR